MEPESGPRLPGEHQVSQPTLQNTFHNEPEPSIDVKGRSTRGKRKREHDPTTNDPRQYIGYPASVPQPPPKYYPVQQPQQQNYNFTGPWAQPWNQQQYLAQQNQQALAYNQQLQQQQIRQKHHYEAVLPPPFQIQKSHLTIADVPDNAIIVHSTNCVGKWGPKFALALKAKFPKAFEVYERHCRSFVPVSPDNVPGHPKKDGLLETCLLIPPQKGKGKVWIACLFTSYSYGSKNASTGNPGKDSQTTILRQTKTAVAHLRQQIEAVDEGGCEVQVIPHLYEPKVTKGSQPIDNVVTREHVRPQDEDQKSDVDRIGEQGTKTPPPPKLIFSPMINAGNFKVPWEMTKGAIETLFRGWDGEWHLLAPPKTKART